MTLEYYENEWDTEYANDDHDYEDDLGDDETSYDFEDDGDALASAGMGTDEDYGYGGDDYLEE